ncbi:hypothetical protein SDC9_166936 [bioreactor metagenome]|uniref:Uncharacterized protein n=1 Tax=bioreactor metagenome TaxID=1076179 RepID=A0A645FYR5_9ZZZZ
MAIVQAFTGNVAVVEVTMVDFLGGQGEVVPCLGT